jgi:serine/threonine protein kinase
VQSQEADEPSGQTVGPYAILREVGRGGMGTVHEARHLLLGTRVALKRMLPELAMDPRTAARFLREAKVGARLRHPHIASVIGAGNEGAPWLAVEWIDGETMACLLAKGGPLPLTSAIDLLLPIIDALSTAHALGIVHRDVKPQNILLGTDAEGAIHPVLIDFGVAKTMGSDVHVAHGPTTQGSILGTVAYMAPEQIENAGDATAAVDQFAVGVVLYQCLTGRMPFSGANAYEHMHATLHATPEPPSHLAGDLPPEIDDIVLRAMARKPGDRFDSIRALGSALAPFAGERAARRWAPVEMEGALKNVTWSDRGKARPRRPLRPSMRWGLTIGLFASGLAIGGTVARSFGPDDSMSRGSSARHKAILIRASAPDLLEEHPLEEHLEEAVATAAPPAVAANLRRPAQAAPPPDSGAFHGALGTNGAPIVQ